MYLNRQTKNVISMRIILLQLLCYNWLKYSKEMVFWFTLNWYLWPLNQELHLQFCDRNVAQYSTLDSVWSQSCIEKYVLYSYTYTHFYNFYRYEFKNIQIKSIIWSTNQYTLTQTRFGYEINGNSCCYCSGCVWTHTVCHSQHSTTFKRL